MPAVHHVDGLWDRRAEGVAGERAFASTGQGRPDTPPNLVFILADDLGWGDLGCFGSLHIKTPNLDRLAAAGVRFTHAYAGSSTCSPTRVSLYTGRYPGRLSAGLEEPMVTRSEWNGIPADHPTLPSLLVDAGYQTAMFGKWHCGFLPWFSPLRIGFQEFFGNISGAMDYFTHIDPRGAHDLYEGETESHEVGYYTWLVSDRTVEFIERPRTQPFYVQVNYTAPHWPWEGPGDEELARSITERTLAGEQPLPVLHVDGGSLAKYGELVEAMDTGIGRILDALEATGQAGNTLVVFCSDNGGERYSFMWPFVGEKGDLTEGGIRTPLIARWPARLAGGQVSDAPNITMDWTATFLDAAGTAPAASHPLDGVSLLPWLVDGAPYPEHDLVWRCREQGALRRGRWKYLFDTRQRRLMPTTPLFDGPFHLLFDVDADGREVANLAAAHRDVLRELRTAYEAATADLLPYGAPPPAKWAQPKVLVDDPD